MVLKWSDSKTGEMVTNDTKMCWNNDSDEDKCKYRE